MSDEVKYYAVVGTGRTAQDPSGLVRRTVTSEGTVAESIRRDLTWGVTDVFDQVQRGEELGLPKLVEISESDANDLVERFRAKWAG